MHICIMLYLPRCSFSLQRLLGREVCSGTDLDRPHHCRQKLVGGNKHDLCPYCRYYTFNRYHDFQFKKRLNISTSNDFDRFCRCRFRFFYICSHLYTATRNNIPTCCCYISCHFRCCFTDNDSCSDCWTCCCGRGSLHHRYRSHGPQRVSTKTKGTKTRVTSK